LLRIQCGDQIVSSEAPARRREFKEAMRQRNRGIAARRTFVATCRLGRDTNASLAGVVRLLTQDLGSGYRSRGVTTKYFALLGMPLVKTVTSAGPCRKPSSEKESKLVSDQPRSGSIGGTRYGPGAGLRLELATTAHFTLGYAFNVRRGPGEGRGNLFFAIGIRDLFY